MTKFTTRKAYSCPHLESADARCPHRPRRGTFGIVPPDTPHSNNTATSVASLLLGTYTSPAARLGARVYCRFRRTWCRVTSFTDTLIPWPRVQVPKQ